MKVIFLSLLDFSSLEDRNVYTDLLREFVKNGHFVCAVSPVERRKNGPARLIRGQNHVILKIRTGNFQQTGPLEKGLSMLMLEREIARAAGLSLPGVEFDMVLYATPPVTFCRAVKYLKKKHNAKSYLLLKDIFPQNAVDLGMLSVKNPLYRYFRMKERQLYANSDYIGCMSPANAGYILAHNPGLDPESVEVCPNGIEPVNVKTGADEKNSARDKYGVPRGKTVFISGGNIGKPQGADFICRCLEAAAGEEKAFFVFAGSGTDFKKLEDFVESKNIANARILGRLPASEYDMLVNASDAGLVFLDRRFTIPNFPSRLLSYMQASLPVLAATDPSTDLQEALREGDFGLWSESGSAGGFMINMKRLLDGDVRMKMGMNARKYLEENYTSKHSYDVIMRHFPDSVKAGP